MYKYLFLSVSLAAISAPSLAQEAQPEEDDSYSGCCWHPVALPHPTSITVVATGIEGQRGREDYPITVLMDHEVRDLQGPDVTRALRRLPGATLTRNGGQGSFTGLFLRGGGSEQALVLLDGVRVNDPAAPGGGFDFGSMAMGELGKVEVLRGAHSVVWGADALAGVVNLSTRAPNGLQAATEFGGADQFSADAAWGEQLHFGEVQLSGGYGTGRGISAAENATEADGYEQYHLGARGEVRLGDGLKLNSAARLADSSVEIDGFPAPDYTLADTLERQDTRRYSGRVGLEWGDYGKELRVNLSHSGTDRDLVDEALGNVPYYETEGRTWRAEAFGHYRINSTLRLDLGGDWQRDSFAADDGFAPASGEAELASGHALFRYEGDVLRLSAGARYDDHSRFGGEWTFAASGNIYLSHEASIRASYGEGFKPPSLFQLLSDFGNPALSPERSRSYDLGLTVEPVERFNIALSAFRRDSRDLIDYVSCFGVTDGICTGRPFGTYDNVARARAEGFELEADYLFGQDYAGDLHIRASWSYVAAFNRTAGSLQEGNRLARRPRHAVNLSADWATSQSVFATFLGVDLRYVSASFDDAANTLRLDDHVLVDLRLRRPLIMLSDSGQRTLDLTARIENLLDEDYQTAAGYAQPGRTAYVGLRLAL